MIRVVGANPAMDRISTWPAIGLGEVNRATEVAVVPGGKGFNVARAVVRLGEGAAAYGFLGGHVGQDLREMILADGVVDRHTTIASGTRVCFIVVEPASGRSTVLNEPGPAVTPAELEDFLRALRDDCEEGDLLVLSGSLPDSVGTSVAGEIVQIGRQTGARTLVDIHGEALAQAVLQRPWMVKCNRQELAQLLGTSAAADLPGAMQDLRARGIEIVVVTLGAEGALIADDAGIARVRVPAIEEVNPTGSGDLLLAGVTAGIEQGQSPREALILGAACGTAGATHLRPELPPGFDPLEWTTGITLETAEVGR